MQKNDFRCSSHPSQFDGAVPVRMLKNHWWRNWTNSRKSTQIAISRFVLVSQGHWCRSGIHCLWSQPSRRTYPWQVGNWNGIWSSVANYESEFQKNSKILSFNVTQSMYKLCTSQCQCLNVEKSLIESATLISRKIFFRIALQPRYFYGIDNGICQPPHSFLSPLQVCAHNRYRNRIHFYHVGLTHSLFEVVYSNPRLWTAAHLRHEEHANSFIGW